MLKSILQNKHLLVLFLGILIYIIYFTLASFLRYDNFYTGRFDLGNMDQAVWNTINGRIFETSADDGTIISRLAVHADFLLIILSPLYLIWPHAKMLLLTQTIVLAMGAFFVYLIGEKVLKNKNFALLFGFLFLLNPILQYPNLFDFHAVTFATTFLLASFYFFIAKKYFLTVIFLILSGLTKEQVWAVTGLFGVLFLFKNNLKLKLLGASIIFVSFAIFVFLFWFAIPQSRGGGEHFALSYFSEFGDSPSQVIETAIFSPQKIFSTIFEKEQIEYLKQIFRPLGYISILSPLFLIFTIPDLFINLLSSNSQLHQIYYQYNATILPFIFISAIFAVKNIMKFLPKFPIIFIAIYLAFSTLYAAYQLGPLPYSKKPNTDMFTKPQKNKEFIDNFLSKIPKEYNLSASNNLGSHLSQRPTLTTIPIGTESADLVLFLINDYNSKTQSPEFEILEQVRKNKNYVEYLNYEGFVVFKKPEILL